MSDIDIHVFGQAYPYNISSMKTALKMIPNNRNNLKVCNSYPKNRNDLGYDDLVVGTVFVSPLTFAVKCRRSFTMALPLRLYHKLPHSTSLVHFCHPFRFANCSVNLS